MTSINRVTEQGNDTKCYMHGCRHRAQFKCESIARGSSVSSTMSSTAPATTPMTTALLVPTGPAASSSCSWPFPLSSSLPEGLLSTSPRAKQALSLPRCLPCNVGPTTSKLYSFGGYHGEFCQVVQKSSRKRLLFAVTSNVAPGSEAHSTIFCSQPVVLIAGI